MIEPLHPGAAAFEGGLTELGPGVHGWLQPNGLLGESNAGLVVGDGASLLVDTLWDPRLTRRMLTAMAPLTQTAPITTLVNTHSDGDHWWGNQEVSGAEIVATGAAAAVMAQQSPAEMKRFAALARGLRFAASMPFPYPRRDDVAAIAPYVSEALRPFAFEDVRLVRPTRTFSGELELDVGGRRVVLIEVGPAHTPGDLIVWIPDARVALAADILFIGVTPIMWAGPAERWIAALERLLGLGAERFLPGHGPVCGPDEVRRLVDYWRWLDGAARQRLAAGRPPAEAAREIVLGDEVADRGFADWLAPERTLVNVGTIDAHRRGVAGPRSPRDLVGAFFGMALLARERDPRPMTRDVRIELTTRFDVPLQEGFHFITDPANWPRYWPGLVRIEPGSRWREPGDRTRLVLRLLGRPVELQMTLGQFVPRRLVEYASVQRGLPDARHERHFEDAGGGLGYRIVVSYEPRPGWRGILDRVVVRRAIERAMRETIANLERCFAEAR